MRYVNKIGNLKKSSHRMLTVPSLLLMVMVVAISSQDPASTSTSPDTSDSLAPITCYVCYNCLTYEEVQLRQCNASAGEHWCLVSGHVD